MPPTRTDKQKTLDLSLTYRLSGLVTGAKLQLVQASRSPSVVNVALQLPPSENNVRLQDKFPSNTSFWLVLRKFEEGVAGGAQKLNLTSRGIPSTDQGAGQLNYEQPCINIMGRDLSSFADLQKTLAQVGYNSGSVLLRLTFKQDDVAMEEAMTQINTYFNSVQPATTPQTTSQTEPSAAHGAHTDSEMTSVPNADAENAAVPQEGEAGPDPSEDSVMTPAPPLQSETPAQDDDVIASSTTTAVPSTESQFPSLSQPQSQKPTAAAEPSSTTSQQPKFAVYSAPTADTPVAARETYNEADFNPSVEHAQAHQALLSRLSQNKRLQSDKELEEAATSKRQNLASVKSVLVRVRFPDQMMVDLTMSDTDTVATLYTTVRDMLDQPQQPFELKSAVGPKGRTETLDSTSNSRLIADVGMMGRVLVTMVWDASVDAVARRKEVLKPELRGQAKKLEVQLPTAPEEEVVSKSDGKKPEEGKKKAPLSTADKEARLLKMMRFGKK